MKITNRVKNAYDGFAGKQVKNDVSGRRLATDFLRYGNNNKPMLQDWSQVEMSDQDMYTGYSYAAINKRANRASALGKKFLYTEASKPVMEAAKKKDVELEHPYLTLIKKSKEFSRRKFWHDISTYLDLEGVYYLMAVRAIGQNADGTTKVGAVQKFVMLNPYEVRRVLKGSTNELGGYIEAHDGVYREIPKEMIIEIRLLNPFDNQVPYSMTDAAKESQFTMKQAGDYARHAIKGNINAPGAITTDVILEDHIFDNFVNHIKNHAKGEPLYGNGAGGIKWESMQIDLDKAALDKINEIHRSTLFAVSGVSKTAMGIEESGTGREVSKTQKDDFTENAVMPQVEDILDALNLDYRRWYPEWEKDEYEILLDNPLESDREAELKDIEIREKELDVREKLVNLGYEYEIAAKYAHGDITLEELGEPTLEEEITPDEADAIAMREAGIAPDPEATTAEPDKTAQPAGIVANNSLDAEVAINKFVPKEQNEKALKEARKRVKDKIKADKEAAKAEKLKAKEEKAKAKEAPVEPVAEPVVDEPAEAPVVKVEVTAVNRVQANNQIAARDFPDLYEGLNIDTSRLGCIMMDVTKIPVMQYITGGEDDLFEDTDYDQSPLVGENNPHVTILFGLLENGNLWKDKVDTLLEGWKLDTVTINEVSYFDLGDSYAIIGLVEPTEEIIDGHERLTLLPHVNTFSEYHPHITLAYIKHDVDPDKWVKPLNKKYKGQKVKTTGLNYGDLPTVVDNDIDDEHDMSGDDTAKKKDKLAPVDNAVSNVEAHTDHDCTEHDIVPNSTLTKAQNALEPSIKDEVVLQESGLQNAVAQLEGQIATAVIEALRRGDINEAERIIAEAQEESYVVELTAILIAFYTILFPIYAAQLLAARLAEYGLQGYFAMDEATDKYIKESAEKAARSHVQTVIKDLTKVAIEKADQATTEELVRLVEKEAQEQKPNILALLPENPNREDVIEAVESGKFDKDPAYKKARDLMRQGQGIEQVIRAITDEYDNITKTRAKTIARHESSRVFNMAQFQADTQFLLEAGLMDRAYKRLRSRTGDPCPVCDLLIVKTRKNPIPFTKNFADLGETLTATYTKPNGMKAVQKMPITYEAIRAGNVHVNCNCEYELVIKNSDGTFSNGLDLRVTNGKGYNPYRDKDGQFASGPSNVFDSSDPEAIDNFIADEGLDASDEEKKALSFYCGPNSSYLAINSNLRKSYGEADLEQELTNEAKEKTTLGEAVKALDDMIERNQVSKAITTYRQFGLPENVAKKLQEGTEFRDDGYVSTTMDLAHSRTFKNLDGTKPVFATISVKAGSHGIFPSNGMEDNFEQEFILPRGVSFKVTKRQEFADLTILELEVLNA